jgi:hypothetical protein
MYNEELFLRQLEERKGRSYAVPRPIHESLWLQNHDPFAMQLKLGELTFKARAKPTDPVLVDQSIDSTEPNVVACRVVARAGVAQTDD